MHDAFAHHAPTNAQPEPQQQFPSQLSLIVYILSMSLHVMKHSFGQMGSTVLAVSPPNSLCPPSPLAGRAGEAEKSLTSCKHY